MDEQLRLGDSDALVDLKRAWDKALRRLSPEINQPSFESWVKTARPLSLEGDVATVGAASELAVIFLEKYAGIVKVALDSSLGREIILKFVVAPPIQPKSRSAEQAVKDKRPAKGMVSTISLALNDKYTFPNFIVGQCNKLAHAAAQSVAEHPGEVYNPFFLYGGPGLGKTHLLQAVGHYVVENHPGMRVAYVSGEMFTSHYVMALRDRRTEEFRRKYRNVDVLLVDDIQFLASREKTKEEFFHTFNALYQMDKQIILCSDRSPREMHPLEERLKSRFESGLVADIAPPDFQTRIAIIQNKARSERVRIPMPVIECMAELIPTNIRALEGALVTLVAYTSLMKAEISVPLAQEVLGRYMVEKKFADLTPEAVQRVVCQTFGVELNALRGEKRQKDLVKARHVAMYLVRELTEYSLPAIGKAFGGRDHATVVHACRRVKDLLTKDEELKSTVDRLSHDLKQGTALE